MKEFVGLVPPPAETKDVPRNPDWADVAKDLGTDLPVDYKSLIETYGTGAFAEFLWVLNPFTPNENLSLISVAKRRLEGERENRRAFPIPYPLFPEKGGLLPWAVTDNGDTLFWLTVGNPEQWHTVLNPSRSNDYHRYEVGAVGFLTGWLRDELKPMPFKGVFEPDRPAKRFDANPSYDD